jgi:hypothetical protein
MPVAINKVCVQVDRYREMSDLSCIEKHAMCVALTPSIFPCAQHFTRTHCSCSHMLKRHSSVSRAHSSLYSYHYDQATIFSTLLAVFRGRIKEITLHYEHPPIIAASVNAASLSHTSNLQQTSNYSRYATRFRPNALQIEPDIPRN